MEISGNSWKGKKCHGNVNDFTKKWAKSWKRQGIFQTFRSMRRLLSWIIFFWLKICRNKILYLINFLSRIPILLCREGWKFLIMPWNVREFHFSVSVVSLRGTYTLYEFLIVSVAEHLGDITGQWFDFFRRFYWLWSPGNHLLQSMDDHGSWIDSLSPD